MKTITPGLYTFSGMRAGRVYLIEDADGLSIIDTSLASSVPNMLKQIEALGHSAQDVKRILITHAHPDHIGGLPQLKALTGATVIAPKDERAVIEDQAPIATPDPKTLAFPVRYMIPPPIRMPSTSIDRLVDDGDVISEVMGGLHAIFTPGHSPGHMAYWQPEKRVLFAGDTMSNFNGRLRLPFPIFTVDMSQNKQSVKRVAELAPAIVCCGHGEPIVHDAANKLQEFLQRVGIH